VTSHPVSGPGPFIVPFLFPALDENRYFYQTELFHDYYEFMMPKR
jgi:hypothetical protein